MKRFHFAIKNNMNPNPSDLNSAWIVQKSTQIPHDCEINYIIIV